MKIGRDTLTGWADAGFAGASGERSWRLGGFGKLQSGMNSVPVEGDIGLRWQPRLSDTLQFDITANCRSASLGRAAVGESCLRWKPVPTSAVRYGMRLGRLFPPVSLETMDRAGQPPGH